MGIGGVVASSFTQEAKKQTEHERFLHNERVLREAKQALLQYAYSYPDFNNEGPGRLPCPDDNDDGLTGPLSLPLCTSVGRLPWAEPDLNFYDAKDASGERLWYAVSDAFYNLGGGPVVNSDSVGTITIQDQSGSIMYDGAASGIAAIVIAPGPSIERDDNNDGVYEYQQVRTTAPQKNDPRNYLDRFNDFRNDLFFNSQSDTDDDGFILGPVREDDPNSPAYNTIVLNDQAILITAEEIIAVAEKATLQAYQNALRNYSDRLENDVAAAPAPWNRYYPWLYNYAVNNLDSYPSDPVFFNPDVLPNSEREFFLSNIGRVPSIYTDYFSEANSQPIESELDIDFTLTYPITPLTVGYDQVFPAVATGTFDFNNAAQHAFTAISTLPQTIAFSDITPDVVGNDGRLSATAITNQTYQVELWFWDETGLGPPTGIWTICPAGGDSQSDCNRDAAGNPTPGSPNNLAAIEALRVIAEVDFPVGVPVEFDMDYNNAPTVTAVSAANGTGHARIQGLYLGADVINVPVTLSYEIDRNYLAAFNIQETGTLIVSDLSSGNLTLGLRYYPELPAWVFDNGWHDSMQMAYALNYRPDQAPANCSPGTDCLQIDKLGGINDDKISLLAIAGEHDWLDEGADNFANDLSDVFDVENDNIDTIFDIRADNGNDKILVIDEL